jgi:uncharacterized protein (DUF1778 family)
LSRRQQNFRFRADDDERLTLAAQITGQSRTALIRDALKVFTGEANPEILARQELLKKRMKRLRRLKETATGN